MIIIKINLKTCKNIFHVNVHVNLIIENIIQNKSGTMISVNASIENQ